MKYLVVVVLLAAASLNGKAQTAKSAYFLDGTFHNYMLNPAMDAERGYFTLLTGNLSWAANSNVGLSNFIYPYGEDKLTTFMSGTVGQDAFLGRLPQSVRLSTDVDMTLLGAGFRMFGGYTNVSLSLHSSLSASLPKGLFEFAKKGFQKQAYGFSDINMRTMEYVALTIGHSREIIDGLRVGVNAKYLLGLAYANVHVDKLYVEMNENYWMVESHAKAEAALGLEARMTADENGMVDDVEVPAMDDFSSIAPAAHGFAVDLGAVYDMSDFVEGLSVSASLLDLGLINWNYMMKASTRDSKMRFDGFSELDPNDKENGIDAEFEKLGEEAASMLDLYADDVIKKSSPLGATMYLGAEYSMPFYRPMSAAILYGKRFGKFGGWNDVKGYVNVAPVKWFEASVNGGFSTFGASWGWMLNFHPAGVNFFIGSDYMITKVTPQFIPVNKLNAHVNLGLNFALGKRK